MSSTLPPGPLPNTHWTIVAPGTPQDGRPTSQAVCVCGTRRTLRNCLLVGTEARSKSCGCRRGEAIRQTRAADPESAFNPRPPPPNGYAVCLAGSIRGDKWAAAGPEVPDPWYVGPVEHRAALRFRDRREAREWIGRRRVAVRGPGTYSVVPLAFSDQAPRWLPVPLLTAIASRSNPADNCAVRGVDRTES